MAKMNPTQKKAFLARMAKGRRSAGAATSSRVRRSYRIHNDSSGADFGVYRGASGEAAIESMLRDAGHDGPASPNLRATLVRSVAKGSRSAGNAAGMSAKSAGVMRSYVVANERTERVMGTYRATSPAAAISACMRAHPGHSRGMLNAHAVPRPAGRVAGGMVKRRKAPRKAGAAGMVHAGKPAPKRKAGGAIKRLPAVLPKRKGHPRGMVGGGTPAVRMARIETAVTDLARANHAIVSKVVEHERRLNSVEITLSNWAKGRK